MRIEIYKDWIIRSDSMNIILCKSAGMRYDKKIKSEYEIYREESFHASIEQALAALCRKEIRASEATTLKELKKCYTELSRLLTDIKNQLGEDILEAPGKLHKVSDKSPIKTAS